MSLRVLHLIPSFGPGGAERQLSMIAPVMARSGVECHIGYCEPGPNLESLFNSGVLLHELAIKGHHDPRLFWVLWRLIKKTKPHIVQTWLLQMDVLGGIAALCSRVPLVVSERSSAQAYPASWKNLARNKIGTVANAIVANSRGGLDYWRNQGVSTPLYLVPNCVMSSGPSDEFEISIPAGNPLLIFAGRLSEEKNVAMLAQALIQTADKVPNMIALIFGEGPMKEEVSNMISVSGMSNRIILMGYTDKLIAWMKRSDFCISVSKFEGHPNVILEAAAAECPLLISDIPAHREIFDDTSANFIDIDSVDTIIAGIFKALKNPKILRRKAQKARHEVSKYEMESVVQSYLNLYTDLAKLR